MRDDYKAQATASLSPRDYAEKSVEQSALEAVRVTFQSTIDLVSRIQMLAERLCGASPSNPTQGSAPPVPSGILPAMADAASATYSRINSANYELDRIERALN